MKFFNFFKKQKLQDWVTKNAEAPQATILLSSVSFIEAIFFPIPPDVVLIAIISMRKVKRWFFYSSVTLVASILGAIVGYVLGFYFFDMFGESIISFYNLQETFDKISIVFKNQTFFAIVVAALTPIPFKVFTLAGGLFKVNFFTFLIASIVGRAARFYLVGYLTSLYGDRLVKVFFRYFNLISVILVILIAIIFFFIL